MECMQRSAACCRGDVKPHLAEIAAQPWCLKKEVSWRSGDLMSST